MLRARRRERLSTAWCAAVGVGLVGAAFAIGQDGQRDEQEQQQRQEEAQPRETQQQPRQQQQQRRSPDAKTAHELVPLREVERQFAITDGQSEGERLTMTLSAADDGRGYVLAFGDKYRLYLEKDETIFVTQLDLITENKAVLYDPPVELIPSTVEAGRTMRSVGQANVYELDTGEFSRDGRYTHEFQRVTKARFNLPDGEAQGYLIDIVHALEFDNADMEIDLEMGTDDRGIIYWRYRSVLEKLGLFGSTTISQYEALAP